MVRSNGIQYFQEKNMDGVRVGEEKPNGYVKISAKKSDRIQVYSESNDID